MTKKQDATAVEHTFHHLLQAAGGSSSQVPATPASTSVEDAAMPASTEDASTLTAAPAVDAHLITACSDGSNVPAALTTDDATGADPQAVTSANNDALAVPLQTLPVDAASTTTKLDNHEVNVSEPKRKHTGDLSASPVQTSAAAVNILAGTAVNTAVPFQLPQAVVATANTKPEASAAAIALRPKGKSPGAAPSTPSPVSADAAGNDDPAAMALPNATPVVAVIDGEPGESRREAGFSMRGAGDRPSTSKGGWQDATVAWQATPVAEQGATFRSSFLHESGATRGVPGQVNDAMEVATEPLLPTVQEGPVKHLEVSLKDAGLGDISVRAEMKDGMLHASVLGGHADSFLTASALHGFLEGHQVAIHTVRVESASGNGVQKTVSTSTFASDSFGGDGRGERNQQERTRSMWPGTAMNFNSGERSDWSRMPSMTAQILPQVQYGDGRSLSIHI